MTAVPLPLAQARPLMPHNAGMRRAYSLVQRRRLRGELRDSAPLPCTARQLSFGGSFPTVPLLRPSSDTARIIAEVRGKVKGKGCLFFLRSRAALRLPRFILVAQQHERTHREYRAEQGA